MSMTPVDTTRAAEGGRPDGSTPSDGTSGEPVDMARGGPRPARGTLNQLFFEAVEKYDRPNALQVKIGERWEAISHRTLADRVRRTALGLRELGLRPGDRVAILSENRPEWAVADYACLTARLIDVTIYPTLPASQIAGILQDSGASAIFVSHRDQAQKIAEIRGSLPALTRVIAFDDVGALADITLADIERQGAASDTPERAKAYYDDAMRVQPDDVATLIYTSGTTGEPKGVMLTHDNIFSNVAAARVVIDFFDTDVALSFLPLSHIFERMAGHFLTFTAGVSIAYAESIDALPQNLREVRPTLLISTPRVYEKVYARVLDTASQGGAIKLRIFKWASAVANRYADALLAGKQPGGLLAAQYRLANKLVFGKILEATGGRVRYAVSGGAPLSAELNKFFFAIGLWILEGYGLTETSPVIAVNVPGAMRIGTVGRPLAGVEVGIAADGEILTRGPHVMKGYFNKPEATAEAIDANGWFHTGDIGELHDGFLSITDRKKDLIVTAGGKNIAPQPIENRIRQNKYVAEAVVIGDKRKFPAVIVVPAFDQLERWAKYKNLTYTDHAQLITLPAVQDKMEREVLGPLSDLAHFEVPKKVLLLEHEFSLENGELTPTLKVKRRVIDTHYKEQIDALYREAEHSAPVQHH
jgi:long-chain acyl-CoA synthetase